MKKLFITLMLASSSLFATLSEQQQNNINLIAKLTCDINADFEQEAADLYPFHARLQEKYIQEKREEMEKMYHKKTFQIAMKKECEKYINNIEKN